MRTHIQPWVVMTIAVVSCTAETGRAPVRTTPPPPARITIAQHMHLHLDAAIELQQAITHGRRVEARELATLIASHRNEDLEHWQPYADELWFAAMHISQSEDLPSMGAQLGRLGHTCGACHLARGSKVTFPVENAPPDNASIEAQMQRHQWAAARLWEGVIAPSETSWNEGARVMADARIELAATTNAKPNETVVELAEHLRTMARDAAGVKDHRARADLYGKMMATCAGCHSVVRLAPVVHSQH